MIQQSSSEPDVESFDPVNEPVYLAKAVAGETAQ